MIRIAVLLMFIVRLQVLHEQNALSGDRRFRGERNDLGATVREEIRALPASDPRMQRG